MLGMDGIEATKIIRDRWPQGLKEKVAVAGWSIKDNLKNR
jgi:hypothetical protein